MWALFTLELRVAFRRRAELVNPLWFFFVILTLFPLALGPDSKQLAHIAPGAIWIAALLASLLAQERLLREDYQDGTLEQLMLLPVPLPAVVLNKIVAHWCVTGLPLLLFSPLAALLMGLDFEVWKVMTLTLLMGTPTLSLLAAPGTGLTVGLPRGGVLLSLLVLPFTLPLLIFATAAINAAAAGLPVSGYMAILAALLTSSAMLCPFATAAALRVSLQG